MGETTDQAKGRVKQAAGDLTDNDDLKTEGKGDELLGKAKGALDDLQRQGRGRPRLRQGQGRRRTATRAERTPSQGLLSPASFGGRARLASRRRS